MTLFSHVHAKILFASLTSNECESFVGIFFAVFQESFIYGHRNVNFV